MSLTRRATPPAGACVIAVTSGTAGAGKTTVATQLALALARLDREVALVAADRAIDVLSGTGRDFVILDTPTRVGDPMLEPIRAAYALVVTSDEPAALVDAYAMIARLLEENADRPVGVVMNNVGDLRRATIACAQLSHAARTFLGHTIDTDAVIVHDPAMSRRSAEPIVASTHVSAAAVRSVRRLAARLVSWRRPDPTPDPSAPAVAITRTRRFSVLAEASRCA